MKQFNALILGIVAISSCNAFVPSTPQRQVVTKVQMADPFVVDATIALVSAVAGIASQTEKIRDLEAERDQLEEELLNATIALDQADDKVKHRIDELEESLFRMDEEFEQQTTQIKREYDITLMKELDQYAAKVKAEYNSRLERVKLSNERETSLKLEEQAGRLQQDFLIEKADYIGNVGGGAKVQAELASLKLKQQVVELTNRELEEALQKAQEELEKLQDLKNQNNNNSKWFWPFQK